MANFRNRKRLERLERRLFGTPAQRQHQQDIFDRLSVRIHIIARDEQARDGIPGDVRVPDDPEAAWTDYVAWVDEASCPFRPDGDPLTHERYLTAFEREAPLYLKSCLQRPT